MRRRSDVTPRGTQVTQRLAAFLDNLVPSSLSFASLVVEESLGLRLALREQESLIYKMLLFFYVKF